MKPLYKFSKNLCLASALIASGFISTAIAKPVSLTDSKLQFLGTNYVNQTAEQVSFTRHSKEVLSIKPMELAFNAGKAQTTSGIALKLATNSNSIAFKFVPLPTENRGSEFVLFENNVAVKTYTFPKKAKQLDIAYTSKLKGAKEYKLMLPTWSNVGLQAISIDDEAELLNIKTPRNAKYVAMGDSITHGVGQKNATQTYPYIVADALNFELFNIAVGGGKTSIPTAQMLADFDDIELITLLIGYNDWNSPKADVAVYQANLDKMLSIIRKSHPQTTIYCITPLFTKSLKAKRVDQPLNAYRQAVIDVVTARQKAGDDNINVIKGDQITSVKNLREDNPKDPVHLGINGARMLAKELIEIIK
ncbi:SGNH/GDSL hydrolase family protein [Thalassomonas sp. M1454]|uniref:SGNH/GDSL hydrolase family protein n=1 Tax=Thalassomonas sp. M1454 TaxID=2594477 RepID=UPI00117E78CB|nr:GDSL-type esterase/lipase family protein [Thalassomonas sp. M1454]TRX53940.1 hypothetical protein FNN08_13385 [Thalassomonas sp. M1454]